MSEPRERMPERDDLLKSFRAQVREQELFPKDRTVLVGVSGRSDSVALLRLLAHLARESNIRLVVGHVQGETPEAKADAMFVHHLATTLALPFEAVSAEADNQYRAFWVRPLLNLAKTHAADLIATAETQDDAAERLLAVLLDEASSFSTLLKSVESPFVRPLLPFSHEACLTFLTRRGFQFRTNPGALAVGTLSANIRLLVMPLLRRHLSRDASKQLATAGELLAAEDAFLHDLAGAAREEVRWREMAEGLSFDRARWEQLPPPLRYHLLADAARTLLPEADLSRSDLLHLESQCRSLADGGVLDMGRLKITRAGGILTLHVGSPPPHSA